MKPIIVTERHRSGKVQVHVLMAMTLTALVMSRAVMAPALARQRYERVKKWKARRRLLLRLMPWLKRNFVPGK